jgi:hypothetical protein
MDGGVAAVGVEEEVDALLIPPPQPERTRHKAARMQITAQSLSQNMGAPLFLLYFLSLNLYWVLQDFLRATASMARNEFGLLGGHWKHASDLTRRS